VYMKKHILIILSIVLCSAVFGIEDSFFETFGNIPFKFNTSTSTNKSFNFTQTDDTTNQWFFSRVGGYFTNGIGVDNGTISLLWHPPETKSGQPVFYSIIPTCKKGCYVTNNTRISFDIMGVDGSFLYNNINRNFY